MTDKRKSRGCALMVPPSWFARSHPAEFRLQENYTNLRAPARALLCDSGDDPVWDLRV
jgi:hypothetical protein